ncbi:hypothetical protein [Massilia aquatica]|uniref:hypothetical protein n=1 Tax=Massilia aquatica TaxID=2609000 RepID=UPI001E3831F7|nr:hypothetical protein [Massilia aquatica]
MSALGRLFPKLTVAFVLGAAWLAPACAVQQAFLVQNSGWMEPFYTDPDSQFKPLIAAVAGAAASPGDKLTLLAFSQTSGTNVSPLALGEIGTAGAVMPSLAALGLARKGGPNSALADTDFQEAIGSVIRTTFGARPGIIWIFTNNKNSPGNDPATAARNLDFYRMLHLEPSITRTLVFPLKMPVQGKKFAARGLMVYALAYGKEAGDELNKILANGRLSAILTRQPARLKPVDQDGVRIVPESILNTPDIKASIGRDQRTLVLDVEASKLVPAVRLKASLENLFYPYLIGHAGVQGTLRVGQRTVPLEVTPANIDNLAPGERKSIEVNFKLPLEEVPSAWSRQSMAAMGKQVTIPMTVELGLSDQQLALPDSFKAEMAELFPGDPISDVFVPPASVRVSMTRVPLLVRVQYPMLPVLVVIGAVFAFVAALLGLLLLSSRSTRYAVHVDGVRRQVVLKPFRSLVIQDGEGNPVGTLRRGVGGPQVSSVLPGHTLTLG